VAIDLDNPSIAPPTATDLGADPGGTNVPAIAPPVAAPAVAPGAVAPSPSPQDVSQKLSQFATDTMATPSRFDIPMVQQGIDLMDYELQQQGEQQMRNLAETTSARGLVGSSIELESQADLAKALEHQRQQRMFNLSQLMAQTQGQDRSAAANIGTQAVSTSLAVPGQSFEQQLAAAEFAQQSKIQDRAQELQATGMDRDEAFRQAQSETQKSQFGSEQQLRERSLELQNKGMDQSEALSRAQMEQQQGQFVTQLQESQESRIQQLGLDTTKLEQSAQALKQQAAVEGRNLDITEARNRAEAELRIDALRQEAELEGRRFDLEEAEQTIRKDQHAAEHAQRRDQFAAELGLSTKQYQEQVDARMFEYEDRNAERLLRTGLQEGTLEHDAAQAALNRSLEREALKLQKTGLDAETAWREADRNLQRQLEESAQKLQAKGMSDEVAWREAETAMQETIQRRRDESAAVLQAAGIEGDAQADLLNRQHAVDMQTAQAEDDLEAQKQAENARLKLETDMEAAGAKTDKARRELDREHEQDLQDKRDAIQQKGYDSEKAWRDALNTHERGQRTLDRSQEKAETERKLKAQKDIAREASFTAMFDTVLQYAEGTDMPEKTLRSWLQSLEDMRAGPETPEAETTTPTTGPSQEEIAMFLGQTDNNWQEDWTVENGEWLNGNGESTGYFV
jgi:hypothetical protein